MRQLRRRRRQRRNMGRGIIGVLRLRQLPDYLVNSPARRRLRLVRLVIDERCAGHFCRKLMMLAPNLCPRIA